MEVSQLKQASLRQPKLDEENEKKKNPQDFFKL